MDGQTLSSLPLSMANALEPLRTARDVNLNGESAQVAGEASTGGVLSGFQVLTLRIEPGGGLGLARVEAELCQWRSRIFFIQPATMAILPSSEDLGTTWP